MKYESSFCLSGRRINRFEISSLQERKVIEKRKGNRCYLIHHHCLHISHERSQNWVGIDVCNEEGGTGSIVPETNIESEHESRCAANSLWNAFHDVNVD